MSTPIEDWWYNETEKEIEGVIPKAIEYGSVDLEIIGHALKTAIGHDTPASDAEVGVAFYLLGKVARMIGAYTDGRSPSDDTWHDAAVYVKMGQRIRYTGGSWPA